MSGNLTALIGFWQQFVRSKHLPLFSPCCHGPHTDDKHVTGEHHSVVQSTGGCGCRGLRRRFDGGGLGGGASRRTRIPATAAVDVGGTGCGGGHSLRLSCPGMFRVRTSARGTGGVALTTSAGAVVPRSKMGGGCWRPLRLWSARGRDGEDAAAGIGGTVGWMERTLQPIRRQWR